MELTASWRPWIKCQNLGEGRRWEKGVGGDLRVPEVARGGRSEPNVASQHKPASTSAIGILDLACGGGTWQQSGWRPSGSSSWYGNAGAEGIV
jgi:hypothetical protein